MSEGGPRTAMVLAAGYGTRMRPLTESTPKPMIRLMNIPLIDRILERLSAAGVRKVVVNTHHLAEVLAEHLKRKQAPEIVLSHEPELLDTGGGIVNALDELGEEPFYVVNGDVFWLDGYTPALERLANTWNADTMDALVLVAATTWALGYAGQGDFHLDGLGRARRRLPHEVAPFAFAGLQILHPRLFRYAPEPPFSLNLLFDQAEASERLHGLRHDGLWFHLSTPDDLKVAEDELADLGFRPRQEENAA